MLPLWKLWLEVVPWICLRMQGLSMWYSMGLVIGLCREMLLQLKMERLPRLTLSSCIWSMMASRCFCLSFIQVCITCDWQFFSYYSRFFMANSSSLFFSHSLFFWNYFMLICFCSVARIFSSSSRCLCWCWSQFLKKLWPPSQFLRVWSKALVSLSRSQSRYLTSLQFRLGTLTAEIESLKGSSSLQILTCWPATSVSQTFLVWSTAFFWSSSITDFWSSSWYRDWQAFWQFNEGWGLISSLSIMFWSMALRRFCL